MGFTSLPSSVLFVCHWYWHLTRGVVRYLGDKVEPFVTSHTALSNTLPGSVGSSWCHVFPVAFQAWLRLEYPSTYFQSLLLRHNMSSPAFRAGSYRGKQPAPWSPRWWPTHEVHHPVLTLEKFLTSTLMDPYSVHSCVTFYHASATHMIYSANQNRPGGCHCFFNDLQVKDEKPTMKKVYINHISGHSCPLSSFKAFYFHIGKMLFGPIGFFFLLQYIEWEKLAHRHIATLVSRSYSTPMQTTGCTHTS